MFFILSSMETNTHPSDDWRLLAQFFPLGWEEKAKSLGAILRYRKLSAADLLRLLLIHLADGCSMRETVARAKHGGLVTVSDVALLKRLRASSEWLRWMAVELLAEHGKPIVSPAYLSDYTLKSVDATIVSEPGSTGTDWRVHYCLNLITLQCDQFIVSRQKVGESFCNFAVHENDLFIGDRAYGRSRGLKHVRDHQGHFLVRIKNKAFPMLDDTGHAVSLLREAEHLAIGELKELNVHTPVLRGDPDLAMRLIIIRKSDQAAEQSIRRVESEEKSHQLTTNATTLALHRYIILVTSLPETITAKQAADLYRMRWQIEIAFKRLKSILGLGHLPKRDVESCRAWLHGKLFVAQLVQSVIEAGRALSPWGYPIRP